MKTNATFFDPTTLKVGNHTFTLKNCKKQIGHDDSTPYTASLYIDNKRVCTLYNDGWGGETNCTQIINAELLETAINDVKNEPYSRMPWEKDKEACNLKVGTLTSIVDTIAENILCFTPLYRRYGLKVAILAIDQNSDLRFCKFNTSRMTEKELIENSKIKAEEYAKRGYYILTAPHFHISK